MPKKVFLYNSSASHNAYRNMVANAPEGFDFVEGDFMAHGIFQASQGRPSGLGASVKRFVRGFQPFLSSYYNHAHILLSNPKVRKFHSGDCDLVHSSQSLLESNLPYVVDFEHAAVFSGFNQYALRRPGFIRALERILLDKNLKGTSNNCHRSSGAPSLLANDSALFSFRFCAVHPKDVRDCQLWQFFEVPLRRFSYGAMPLGKA